MNNYQIIKNEKILNDFIDWLPELGKDECFYVALFSRKKYSSDKNLKSDKAQLKRFTSTKKYLIQKIQQLEIQEGCYYQDEYPIPQDSLSIYITPNPRSYEKAAKKGLVRLAELITKDYSGYNPHQEMMSQIQKSCKNKVFLDFDFDIKDLDFAITAIREIHSFVNKNAVHILWTHSGFHALVELLKIEEKYKKGWHQGITSIPGCDVRGDNLIPIPGCFQGGFVPYFEPKIDVFYSKNNIIKKHKGQL